MKFGWRWRTCFVSVHLCSSIRVSVTEPIFTKHYIAFTYLPTDQKRLESFEMWCWRRMEKISWTDHVRNGEVLLRVNEQRNILHQIRKRKANWIGHILRGNCLLQVIEGKIKGQIEVTRRRGRRRKRLLDDLKDRRGYCQLKEEALERTMWRNRFGRGFGPVVWQITDDDDDLPTLSSKYPKIWGRNVKECTTDK